MGRDLVGHVCPFSAGRFITSPLESKDGGGFKLVEEDEEGLKRALPPFHICCPFSLWHAG